MKSLLTSTSPSQAFEMFKQTFKQEELPAQLDNAFIYFTNYMSLLRTDCVETIANYANQEIKAEHLDVLAICHLFNHQAILYGMLSNFEEDLIQGELNIRNAKHQREITDDIFSNDLHEAYSETINKYQKIYNKARRNIHLVNGMIYLIKALKKNN